MLVGVVPMGGYGERWAPYPCPKELLPFGHDERGRPRVIGDYVMARMTRAGVELIVVPVRPEKAMSVMTYFGHCYAEGPAIAYVAAPGPSLVANLRATVPLLAGHTVLFGMPDTYFTPIGAFRALREQLGDETELVLGCWVHPDPRELDTVEIKDGRALRVKPKPRSTEDYTREVWGIAAWTPGFTERLRTWNDPIRHNPGFLFAEVAKAGRARAVVFPGERYVDVASYAPWEAALREVEPRLREESSSNFDK